MEKIVNTSKVEVSKTKEKGKMFDDNLGKALLVIAGLTLAVPVAIVAAPFVMAGIAIAVGMPHMIPPNGDPFRHSYPDNIYDHRFPIDFSN